MINDLEFLKKHSLSIIVSENEVIIGQCLSIIRSMSRICDIDIHIVGMSDTIEGAIEAAKMWLDKPNDKPIYLIKEQRKQDDESTFCR